MIEKAEEAEERRLERAIKAEAEANQPKEAQETARKLTYQERKELGKLEKAIEKLESRKTEIHQLFGDTSISADKITELSKELASIEEELEEKEMSWLELSEFV